MKNHEKSIKNGSRKSEKLMSACSSSSMPKKAAPGIPGHPLMTRQGPQGSWGQGGGKGGGRGGVNPSPNVCKEGIKERSTAGSAD